MHGAWRMGRTRASTAGSPAGRLIGPGRRLRQCGLAVAAVAALAAGMPLAPAHGQARADEPRVTACAAPNAPAGPRLHVSVVGARRVAGNITISIYGPHPERFLARRAYLARQRIPLRESSVQGCFALSAPGDYAIAVYHDENDDHDFNRSLIGLPAEGYGFSNDAPTVVGLPSFDAVRLAVPAGGTSTTIHLRY